jgi:uncharacterized protein YmfQ (DUF2313 family)
MTWPKHTEQFRQSLAHLLPPGFAFPRDPNSNVQRVMRALAAVLAEFKQHADDSIKHSIPINLCCDGLDGWEQTVGLPDDCTGQLDTCAERKAAILGRMARVELEYDDSSTATIGTLGFLTKMAKAAGYDVTITAGEVFRAGRNVAGDRLGQNGVLNINVGGVTCDSGCEVFRAGVNVAGDNLQTCWESYTTTNDSIGCEVFRAGVNVAGDRLQTCRAKVLECLFDKIAPARFKLIFNYCDED